MNQETQCNEHQQSQCLHPAIPPFSRPIQQFTPAKMMSAPHCMHFSRPSKPFLSSFPGPSAPTAATLNHFLAHGTTVNDATTPQDDPVSEPVPNSLVASTISTQPDMTSPSSTDSEDAESSCSNMPLVSTASDRQLCPCIPINYNETLLKCLQGGSQGRTFNNISIPMPTMDSDSEDTDPDEEDMNTITKL